MLLYELLLRELSLETRLVFSDYKINENILTIYIKNSSDYSDIKIKELADIKFIMNKYKDLFKYSFEKEYMKIELLKGV